LKKELGEEMLISTFIKEKWRIAELYDHPKGEVRGSSGGGDAATIQWQRCSFL
jgi:hypothetical protein